MSIDTIRLAGIEKMSSVDGEGIRTVIFTQGCLRKCPGCHNESTWDMNGGYEEKLDYIYALINDMPDWYNGITISGGEPFLQELACYNIAKHAKSKKFSVWVYTGYTREALESFTKVTDVYSLLQYTDVLVDGPYVQELRSYNLRFRGSSNQRIIYLT